MQTFITLEYARETALPPEFEGDVRTPAAFVRHFLREFSAEGDVVFDPFAGFGTTLRVAEELGREPYGIEYEADRVAVIRDRIDHAENVVHGSALELDVEAIPAFDCCLTSPPYMEETMDVDPFQNYAGESSYDRYLDDIEGVFARLRQLAAPDARVLVDVSNMKYRDHVTTLAWDVADAASASFRFDGEVLVGWRGEGRDDREGTYGYGYDHNYCLVFSNRSEAGDETDEAAGVDAQRRD